MYLESHPCCIHDTNPVEPLKGQWPLPEFQAPEGTYIYLNELVGNTLGNIMTKRIVWVNRSEQIPKRLQVVVRVKGLRTEDKSLRTHYRFGINEKDQIETIEAEFENPRRTHTKDYESFEPPPFDEIMEHIRQAVSIEPDLKYNSISK